MKECNCNKIKTECKHDWQDKGIHQENNYSGQLGVTIIPSWVIFVFCTKCHVLKKIYAKITEG